MAAMPSPIDLGSRCFSLDDSLHFAALSGDVNPMHVDLLAARRLLTGKPVVHGVHTLITALDAWLGRGGAAPRALGCDFTQAVSVGDRVHLTATRDAPGAEVRLAATAGERVCMSVDAVAPGAHAALAIEGELEDFSALAQPVERVPEDWSGRCGRIDPRPGAMATRFPHACAALGVDAVRALGALSYLVGMVCPGLHSIFASLRVDFAVGIAGQPLRFRVERYDGRFRLLVVSFDGALRGDLRAFVRPTPPAQPSMDALASLVDPGEFAGTHSVVIGGSRGLGEVTAKLLAAGGSEVLVTYATGAADAARVADEINAAGRGRCHPQPYLLGTTDPAALGGEGLAIDALFYFATPRIARRSARAFDAELFADFSAAYGGELARLCVWANALRASRPVRVFNPSSVYVAERPRGMTEYAMAKAAAEVLLDDLARTLRGVRIFSERLPMLETDQTAAVRPAKTASNIDVLLPIVRRVMAT
jgi:NAD(P)-dependent dehydrogenase (short-subunit alcohol dehydrogenase family)